MKKKLTEEQKSAMAKGRAALLESVREAREKDLLVVKDQKGGVWHLFRFDSLNFAIVRHWKRDGEMVEDDPLFYPTFQDAVYGLFGTVRAKPRLAAFLRSCKVYAITRARLQRPSDGWGYSDGQGNKSNRSQGSQSG